MDFTVGRFPRPAAVTQRRPSHLPPPANFFVAPCRGDIWAIPKNLMHVVRQNMIRAHFDSKDAREIFDQRDRRSLFGKTILTVLSTLYSARQLPRIHPADNPANE